jgi:hypothetical protein
MSFCAVHHRCQLPFRIEDVQGVHRLIEKNKVALQIRHRSREGCRKSGLLNNYFWTEIDSTPRTFSKSEVGCSSGLVTGSGKRSLRAACKKPLREWDNMSVLNFSWP